MDNGLVIWIFKVIQSDTIAGVLSEVHQDHIQIGVKNPNGISLFPLTD